MVTVRIITMKLMVEVRVLQQKCIQAHLGLVTGKITSKLMKQEACLKVHRVVDLCRLIQMPNLYTEFLLENL